MLFKGFITPFITSRGQYKAIYRGPITPFITIGSKRPTLSVFCNPPGPGPPRTRVTDAGYTDLRAMALWYHRCRVGLCEGVARRLWERREQVTQQKRGLIVVWVQKKEGLAPHLCDIYIINIYIYT